MILDLSALTLRPTREEDWEILKTIRVAALLDSPTAFGLSYATAAAYSEQQWRERASHETQPEFLLAIDREQAVGLIGGFVGPTEEYKLIAMWVHPKCRGKGIAGRLVDAIKTRVDKFTGRKLTSTKRKQQRHCETTALLRVDLSDAAVCRGQAGARVSETGRFRDMLSHPAHLYLALNV
jgi:GNAT superfamily N-acetyltransferase